MTWTRAIARITVGGEGGWRGTGALISLDGLVLTAFHVLADSEKSIERKAAVFHPGTIRVEFGKEVNRWMWGDGSARCEKFSITDDWALLRLPQGGAPPLGVIPFPLAKADSLRIDFQTFGFPKLEKKIGGEYIGKLGALDSRQVQLIVDNLPVGQDMGGISGAPCIVDGHIVGVIQQSLANERGEAVTASLYMLPIEYAVAAYPGLLEWDDGTDVTFQKIVEVSLPDDASMLATVGQRLKLPHASCVRRYIARRLLAIDMEAVADSLSGLPLDPVARAKPILDCVGAMAVHSDAIEGLRKARAGALMPWIEACTRRVHWWCLRRAFEDETKDPNKLVMLRLKPGFEEAPRREGQSSDEAAVGQIVERVRKSLAHRVSAALIDGMLGANSTQTPEQARRRRFWLILIGELRPTVLALVRKRLPNAYIVLGKVGETTWPEDLDGKIAAVFPVVAVGDERDLIEAWGSSASQLNVPPEQEDDDA